MVMKDDIEYFLRIGAPGEVMRSVRLLIVGEIEPASANSGISRARWSKLIHWIGYLSYDSEHAQALLKLIQRSSRRGKWYFEDIEDIAKRDPNYGKYGMFLDVEQYDWVEENGVHVPKPRHKPSAKPSSEKGGDVRKKAKPLERLRPISGVAGCPYIIDLPSNSITHRPSGKTYRIPKGDASKVINRLVRGMVACMRKKRSGWLVRFTREDERILHRASGSTDFYKECISRTAQRGDGHQLYGDTARLKG